MEQESKVKIELKPVLCSLNHPRDVLQFNIVCFSLDKSHIAFYKDGSVPYYLCVHVLHVPVWKSGG